MYARIDGRCVTLPIGPNMPKEDYLKKMEAKNKLIADNKAKAAAKGGGGGLFGKKAAPAPKAPEKKSFFGGKKAAAAPKAPEKKSLFGKKPAAAAKKEEKKSLFSFGKK